MTKRAGSDIINVVRLTNAIEYAPLAQLDRAFGYGPEGRGFESLRARWNLRISVESFLKEKLSFLFVFEDL